MQKRYSSRSLRDFDLLLDGVWQGLKGQSKEVWKAAYVHDQS